jgi:hypothetical protein
MNRLGPEQAGTGCVSAPASGVPKHFRTLQVIKDVILPWRLRKA